jgi:ribosomal-protein-alanine N-acetyltransferase
MLPAVRSLLSDRLLLRPMTEEDFPFLVELHADPSVARYLGDGQPRSADASRLWFDVSTGGYLHDGTGHYAIVVRESGALIGRSGLGWFEIEDPDPPGRTPMGYWGPDSAPEGMTIRRELELGYVLRPGAWGKGYATEAARTLRAHAFGHHDQNLLISLIHAENARSAAVAERLGARHEGDVEVFGSRARRFVMRR